MLEDDPLTIDCDRCVAAGTSACNECVVGHLLANDDGPIELVVAARPTWARRPRRAAADATSRVVALFERAGLLDDPPVFVTAEEFAAGLPAAVRAHPAGGGRPAPSR
jgi:hypothetical protein